MSRATVRSALIDFLDGAVPGLNKIYRSTPYIIPGTAFTAGTPAGTATGAIAAVHFDSSYDVRLTMGTAVGEVTGTGAQKVCHYQVALYVRVHSRLKDAEQAMDDADAIYDALLTLLRSPAGHTLGSPSTVFLAGEDKNGDLRLNSDEMKADDKNSLWQYSTLSMTVQEIVES